MKKFNLFLMFSILFVSINSCKKDEDEQVTEQIPTVKFPGETVLVESGSFLMGGGPLVGESPIHNVILSSFRISKYEITNQQYADFMNAIGANSDGSYEGTQYLDIFSDACQIEYAGGKFVSKNGRENYPVIKVTWFGAKAYSEYYGGRLPTEAEWEFAARGGNSSNGYGYSGSTDLDEVGWYLNNSDETGNSDLYDGCGTFPVGIKSPNELGIYDMSGNVWEWCNDWYDIDYYSISPVTDPQGPSSGTTRVRRGGSWIDISYYCVTIRRYYFYPNNSDFHIGFRPVFAP